MIDSQMDDMIKEKLALKEQIDSLEKNLSKQIKERKCLLQTFTIFKSDSKEKEDKYMENKIDLEKKIKELDNILFKVGQSAQTVHMLTKPQAFYDNIHKQALGMFKLYLEPLAPRLLQNKDVHIKYLKYAQEQADTFEGIVETAKANNLLDKELDFSCKDAQRRLECSTSCLDSSLVSGALDFKTHRTGNRSQLMNFVLNKLAKEGHANEAFKIKFLGKINLYSACAFREKRKELIPSTPTAEDTKTKRSIIFLLYGFVLPMRVSSINGNVYLVVCRRLLKIYLGQIFEDKDE
ncbi:hypothetical protein Tco_1502121 [Tanacetum coccineum]